MGLVLRFCLKPCESFYLRKKQQWQIQALVEDSWLQERRGEDLTLKLKGAGGIDSMLQKLLQMQKYLSALSPLPLYKPSLFNSSSSTSPHSCSPSLPVPDGLNN